MAFLTYGGARLPCDPPGDVELILPEAGGAAAAPAELVARALDAPLGTPPLAELARGRRSAIVLIACRTRRTGSHVFLPEIVSRLGAAGIPDERILIYAATGTHANWRPEDAPLLAGAELGRRLRFAGHDCRGNLAEVGVTSRGHRVLLSRDYLDAELKIATGRVTHHYFAGFTGGRKAVLPGVAGFESILQNHRLASRTAPRVELHPGARNGCLDGNPVHEDMLEAARLAPPDFSLCTVLDPDEEIVAAFGGDWLASHAPAVRAVAARDAKDTGAPADWLFLSCGGAHADVNAVQAIKAVVNNLGAVRPGGAIVLSAECAEGMPAWLRETAAIHDRAELHARIARGELRHPHNALWLARVRERAPVLMLTKLPEDDVRALGFEKVESLAHAMARAADLAGRPARSIVMPQGNVTVVRERA